MRKGSYERMMKGWDTHLWTALGATDGEEDEGANDGRDAGTQEGHHITS